MNPTLLSLSACLSALFCAAAFAQEPEPTDKPGVNKPTFSASQQKAFDWLFQQQENGVFSIDMRGQKFQDPGVSALALQGLQTKPAQLRTEAEQKAIDQGVDWLLQHQNDDGSFGQRTPNYVTCVVVGALADGRTAGKSERNDKIAAAMQKAQKYILAIQNLEATQHQKSDPDYGSIGYGTDGGRGDLNNTTFALQALRQTGLPADQEAFAKAIVFLQRTQNLKSVNDYTGEAKDAEGLVGKVVPGTDGGAVYYPGNSPFGYVELPDGTRTPRSYGSMTYALLKAYTMAGVDAKDPRVQAAAKWVQEHWTLTENPGGAADADPKEKQAGLYYYYMLLAQALDAIDIDKIGGGGEQKAVDWRAALKKHLADVQQKDGSWVNSKNNRWYEGMPLVATAYAMVALSHCD